MRNQTPKFIFGMTIIDSDGLNERYVTSVTWLYLTIFLQGIWCYMFCSYANVADTCTAPWYKNGIKKVNLFLVDDIIARIVRVISQM